MTGLLRKTALSAFCLLCATPGAATDIHTDIEFAMAGERPLLLDLYVPEGVAAWRSRDRPVEVNWLPAGGHASGEYFHAPYIQQAADFLRRHLGNN